MGLTDANKKIKNINKKLGKKQTKKKKGLAMISTVFFFFFLFFYKKGVTTIEFLKRFFGWLFIMG